MTSPTQALPAPDANQAEIEADIAATRARLADSVDALADKMNVKARAQEKVDDVKITAQAKVADATATAQAKVADATATAQAKVADLRTTAQAKVADLRTTAQAKVADVRVTAQAKAVEAQEKVAGGTREVSGRVQALPLPAQIALAAAPALLTILLVIRKARS